jgi:hypothetical protein
MKRLTLFLLPAFLLAGCGSRSADVGVTDNEAAAAGAAANAMLANIEAAADDPARIRDMIAKAMPAALSDAGHAQYRNLRMGAGGAACGEVAAKPAGRGAPVFRPFVVNPDGFAVVAATPKMAFDDPGDFVADAWIRWCASPEELQRLAPQLHRAATDPAAAAALNGVDAGTDAQAAEVPAAAPPAQPAKSAAPAAKPPPASVESFFNSVQHKGN